MAAPAAPKLRNVGPKGTAWLRQVGIRSREDLEALGAVAAFIKVKRAGFKPSLNLLYALEGALRDCHWQEIPEARRAELVLASDEASLLLPPPKHKRFAIGEVTTTHVSNGAGGEGEADGPGELRFDGGGRGAFGADAPPRED